jgi:hypothetical protein
VNLTVYLHPVPMLRMLVAVPPLHHTPALPGVCVRTSDNFNLCESNGIIRRETCRLCPRVALM